MPLLTPAVEAFVHRSLRGKLIAWPGAFVHEVGGTDNHVHVAVSVFPTILISDLAGQLKGSSAHEANWHFGQANKVLEWQAGYGAVSFGTAQLPWVIEYIRNQREHHGCGDVHDRLERIEPLPETAAVISGASETPQESAETPAPMPRKPR